MDGGAVAGAVVGQDSFDLDAVSTVVGGRPEEEANGGCGFLVGEDFGVGEAAVVVDGDVDVLPADALMAFAGFVGVGGVVVLLSAIAPALACSSLDPAELLDVEVDELARSGVLVADRRLEA